jgi:phosphopantetheine adenylyltransferase
MNTTLNISVHKANNKSIETSSEFKSQSFTKALFTKYRAKKEANNIVKSLKEVKDFESGKKQPKSFEDFLKEL